MTKTWVTVTLPTDYGDWPCATQADEFAIYEDLEARLERREITPMEKYQESVMTGIRLMSARFEAGEA